MWSKDVRKRTAPRVLLVVACVIVTIALGQPIARTATRYKVYSAQAEASWMAGGVVVSDSTASGARAVSLKPGTALWRTSTTPMADRYAVRVKAVTCGVPGKLAVRHGADVVGRVAVRNTSWGDVSIPVSLTAGTRNIAIWFDADGVSTPGCVRSIRVDWFALWSDVPVNTPVAGTLCQPSDLGLPWRRPLAGYSTSALGRAPGYYEIAPPTGAHAGESPVGTMILVHGGSWYTTGAGAVASVRGQSEHWRTQGWNVVNVTSGAGCGRWVDDVTWFYDRIRAADPDGRICLLGVSAGGHVALMVAARRPDVSCVINEGGPADLIALKEQRPTGVLIGPAPLYHNAVAAFGRYNLAAFSPRRLGEQIRARVLSAHALLDPVVPSVQGSDLIAALDDAHPDVRHDLQLMLAGTVGFVHARVSIVDIELFLTLANGITGTDG